MPPLGGFTTGGYDGSQQAGRRQGTQGCSEEADTTQERGDGKAGMDETRQDIGRVHGGEKEPEEVQGRPAREVTARQT